MPRIPDEDRLEVIDNNLAHYEQAIIVNGSAFEIEVGFGRPELVLLRNAFETLQLDIAGLADEGGEVDSLLSERDDIFGTSEDDDGGVWFWLKEYKAAVKAHLGSKHPLTRTVPNLGRISPQSYLDICHRYIVHWTRVNASLATPLVLGAFTLTTLTTAYTNLKAKVEAIDVAVDLLNLKREQRDQNFGDETEDEREQTSIIAWLLKYHSVVRTKFPNQPIAASLPEIFPVGGNAPLPTFEYNWVVLSSGVLKFFFKQPNPVVPGAALVFVKEGTAEVTHAVDSTSISSVQVVNFSGVSVVGELDRVEIRNGSGVTIARGARNPAMPEPA